MCWTQAMSEHREHVHVPFGFARFDEGHVPGMVVEQPVDVEFTRDARGRGQVAQDARRDLVLRDDPLLHRDLEDEAGRCRGVLPADLHEQIALLGGEGDRETPPTRGGQERAVAAGNARRQGPPGGPVPSPVAASTFVTVAPWRRTASGVRGERAIDRVWPAPLHPINRS